MTIIDLDVNCQSFQRDFKPIIAINFQAITNGVHAIHNEKLKLRMVFLLKKFEK
jgi:hypothetical protein